MSYIHNDSDSPCITLIKDFLNSREITLDEEAFDKLYDLVGDNVMQFIEDNYDCLDLEEYDDD